MFMASELGKAVEPMEWGTAEFQLTGDGLLPMNFDGEITDGGTGIG